MISFHRSLLQGKYYKVTEDVIYAIGYDGSESTGRDLPTITELPHNLREGIPLPSSLLLQVWDWTRDNTDVP